MANEFDVVDGSGKTMCLTFTDLIHQNDAFKNTYVAAFLDKKCCKQVICQVALLSRLRSIFTKHSDDELRSKVGKAVKNSKKLEEAWEKRPSWWDDASNDHSFLILHRLNELGISNVLTDPSGFGPADQVSVPHYGNGWSVT